VALAVAILLNFVSCTAQSAPDSPQRVLFVGNSVTYYGNVPAVFSALAEANGISAVSDMLVAPDLTWFADDGQHPGKHLALLNAMLVHEAVFGSLPDSSRSSSARRFTAPTPAWMRP